MSHPPLRPSVRYLLQAWDGTPAVTPPSLPPKSPLTLVLTSTDPQANKLLSFQVFFLFFFLLILFKFDAVSVLVWYTLYKYMNMDIIICCREVCCNTSSHRQTRVFIWGRGYLLIFCGRNDISGVIWGGGAGEIFDRCDVSFYVGFSFNK